MNTTERILDLTASGLYGLREAVIHVMEHPQRTATLTTWLQEGRTLYQAGTALIILEQPKDALGRQLYRVQTPDGQEHVCFANELREAS